MIEAAQGGNGETRHGHTDPHTGTPNSEHMKCIVPDSFEYSQCDDYKNKVTSRFISPSLPLSNPSMTLCI